MSKIKIENVCYVYDGGTPFETVALDNINIEIRENTVTGIIGHTGSGKSTLVQMFNGLIKPTSGKILLDGVDIWEKPKEISKVRFRVGLVMQYPEYQLFEETVRADIAFGPKNMGLDDAEVARRVHEAASFVGLDESSLDKSPFDLSGGQKRRAAIAGVMAMRPEVLVLDEPSAGLDPAGKNTIFDGIKRYAAATGAAVIIVSHSMDDMAKYCEDLVVLSHSKVVMSGKRNEVFGQGELLEKIGLGVPQMTGLMMMLREKGIDVPADIYTVDDAEAALARILGGAL
ncbi:MAG: energy-coupling factor transporter ATPase [Ruminococcaceae bacterium]|nr:energy-coupling factor transporter ATPase [Oscillospiraceae bacterium]